ncbi:MAG: GAF domain-containing protein [Candidatus Moduliflexus flocculans]|nr:GAF domain-containing protein [Candidatus Moduliflexus flocculans]
MAGLGFFHVLPLKVEDKVIGCLVMGKKQDGSYFSREDWELLTTISGSAALALENADLYGRESVRAMEMQRLKDYSENIIESLTVGVSVVDEAGIVTGWNRVLEDQVAVRREERARAQAPGRPGPGHLRRRVPAGRPAGLPPPQRDRDRGRRRRRRSSTSPGPRSSTTPCVPTGPSSSSRTSPTRSVSSSSC